MFLKDPIFSFWFCLYKLPPWSRNRNRQTIQGRRRRCSRFPLVCKHSRVPRKTMKATPMRLREARSCLNSSVFWMLLQKSLWRHWGHFRQFWGHFGVISGPFLTLKSNSLQTSLVTTQNDCKRSRMQMKMVLRFNSKMFRSFWGLKWRQMTLKWPGNCRKVLEMASMSSRLLLKSSPSEFCFSCGRFEWSHD